MIFTTCIKMVQPETSVHAVRREGKAHKCTKVLTINESDVRIIVLFFQLFYRLEIFQDKLWSKSSPSWEFTIGI